MAFQDSSNIRKFHDSHTCIVKSNFGRYNGELIQQGLKAVEPVAKAANYEYGAVNNDAIPVLATFLLHSVGIAALVIKSNCILIQTCTIQRD